MYMFLILLYQTVANQASKAKQEAGSKKYQLEKCRSIAPHIYLFKTGINNCKRAEQVKKLKRK